jgi:hypothetical protein
MGIDVRLDHTFDLSPEVFWRDVYFDAKYTEQVFLEGLGMRRVAVVGDAVGADGKRRRQVEVDLAPLELPGPVQKLLKGGLGYREDLVFDAARGEATFTYRFNQLTDRLVMSGRMTTEETSDGRTRRLTVVHFEANVFGIGGLVEKAAERITRDTWEKSAAYTRQWIARRPPSA